MLWSDNTSILAALCLPPNEASKEPPCSKKARESGKVTESTRITAQHAQFEKEGQTKELEEWMYGPTTKDNFQHLNALQVANDRLRREFMRMFQRWEIWRQHKAKQR